MARPVSSHVTDVRDKLLRRLNDGLHRPGDRFISNRALAAQYNVSYQTAQRLLANLVTEGLLVRKHGAGTYLPGGESRLSAIALMFDIRAKRPGSFGAKLLALLRSRLERLGIPTTAHLIDPAAPLLRPVPASRLPVIWDLPAAVEACAAQRRQALLLNDRPASGFAATHIDSVSVDDFTGGACAAQMLASAARPVIFAGPADDARSRQRVAGFESVHPAGRGAGRRIRVVHAGGWYAEHGAAHAHEVLRLKPDAVFCCNDRLAQALLQHLATPSLPSIPPHPPHTLPPSSHTPMSPLLPKSIVGFDDAPIAAELDLNTIAIPWPELVNAAVKTIQSRLTGDRSAAIRQVVAPMPVFR